MVGRMEGRGAEEGEGGDGANKKGEGMDGERWRTGMQLKTCEPREGGRWDAASGR